MDQKAPVLNDRNWIQKEEGPLLAFPGCSVSFLPNQSLPNKKTNLCLPGMRLILFFLICISLHSTALGPPSTSPMWLCTRRNITESILDRPRHGCLGLARFCVLFYHYAMQQKSSSGGRGHRSEPKKGICHSFLLFLSWLCTFSSPPPHLLLVSKLPSLIISLCSSPRAGMSWYVAHLATSPDLLQTLGDENELGLLLVCDKDVTCLHQ